MAILVRDQRLGANVGSAQGPTGLGKYLMRSPTGEVIFGGSNLLLTIRIICRKWPVERLRQRGAKQAVQEEIGEGEKQAYLPCERVNLLKQKSDVSNIIFIFHSMIQTQFVVKIKTFRTNMLETTSIKPYSHISNLRALSIFLFTGRKKRKKPPKKCPTKEKGKLKGLQSSKIRPNE